MTDEISLAAWIRRERYELVKFGFELALIRAAYEMKYSADQPRAPAGSSDGGRWIDGAAAGFGRTSMQDEGVFHPGAPDDPSLQDAAQRGAPLRPIDLRSGEGGHAIQRHVGKSDTELKAAVSAGDKDFAFGKAYDLEPQGSFDSWEAANAYANDVISSNPQKMQDVMDGRAPGDQIFLTKRYNSPTGREAYSQLFFGTVFRRIRPTFSVGIVIRRGFTPRGYKVVTAYPMNDDPDGN